MIKSIVLIMEDGKQISTDVKLVNEPNDKRRNYKFSIPGYENPIKCGNKGIARFSNGSSIYFEPAKKPVSTRKKSGKKTISKDVESSRIDKLESKLDLLIEKLAI